MITNCEKQQHMKKIAATCKENNNYMQRKKQLQARKPTTLVHEE